MKNFYLKLTLLIMAVVMTMQGNLHGQSYRIIAQEDFEGVDVGDIPQGWTTTGTTNIWEVRSGMLSFESSPGNTGQYAGTTNQTGITKLLTPSRNFTAGVEHAVFRLRVGANGGESPKFYLYKNGTAFMIPYTVSDSTAGWGYYELEIENRYGLPFIGDSIFSEYDQISVETTNSTTETIGIDDILLYEYNGDTMPETREIYYSESEYGVVSGMHYALPGSLVRFVARPYEGYDLLSLKYYDNDGEHEISNYEEFVMPDADITVMAEFGSPCNITVNAMLNDPMMGDVSINWMDESGSSPYRLYLGQYDEYYGGVSMIEEIGWEIYDTYYNSNLSGRPSGTYYFGVSSNACADTYWSNSVDWPGPGPGPGPEPGLCNITVYASLNDPMMGDVYISWMDESGSSPYRLYLGQYDEYYGGMSMIEEIEWEIYDTYYNYNLSGRPSGTYYFGVSSSMCPETYWSNEVYWPGPTPTCNINVNATLHESTGDVSINWMDDSGSGSYTLYLGKYDDYGGVEMLETIGWDIYDTYYYYNMKGWSSGTYYFGVSSSMCPDTYWSYWIDWNPTYHVYVNTTEHGSLSADPTEATEGTTIDVTAEPESGYELSTLYYTESCSDEHHDISLTGLSFTMPTSDVTVYGIFTLKEYTITVNNPEHGSLSTNKIKATMNETINVTAEPDDGYELSTLYYTESGSDEHHDISLTGLSFTMPTSDVTVYGIFTLKEYTITVNNPAHGSLSTNKIKATMNETINVTAEPDNGYRLSELYYIDDESEEHHSIDLEAMSFTMPPSKVTISGVFSPKTYNVDISNPEHGTLSTDKTQATMGETVSVTADSEDGYELIQLYYIDTVSDVHHSINLELMSFSMPASNVTVSGVFSKIYNVSIDETTEHGTLSASPAQAIAGKQISVIATPDEGYMIGNLYYTKSNSEVIYIDLSSRKFDMPESDVTVSADFTQIEVTAELKDGFAQISWNDAGASCYPQAITYSLYCYKIDPANNEETPVLTVNGISGTSYDDHTILGRDAGTYIYCVKRTINTEIFRSSSIEVDEFIINVTTQLDHTTETANINWTDNANYEPKAFSIYRGEYNSSGDPTIYKSLNNNFTGSSYTDQLVMVKAGTYCYGIRRNMSSKIYWSSGFEWNGHDFNISIASATHGSLSANKDKAKIDENVMVNVTPQDGYVLKTLYYTYSGGSNNIDTVTRTFTMPASDVTIYATFIPLPLFVEATEMSNSLVNLDWWPDRSGPTAQNHYVYRKERLHSGWNQTYLGQSTTYHYRDTSWGDAEWGIYEWGVRPIYEDSNSETYWSDTIEKDMWTNLSITVTTNDGDPSTGTRIFLDNYSEGNRYDRTTYVPDTINVCNLKNFRSGRYRYEISKDGYHTQSDYITITQTNNQFSFELEAEKVMPKNLFVSHTGWAMWNYDVVDKSAYYILKVDNGSWESTYSTHYQLDVTGMVEGETHTVYLAAVNGGTQTPTISYTWTYSPCFNYEGVTNLTAIYSNYNTLSWTLPTGNNVLGVMIWRNNSLITSQPYYSNGYIDNYYYADADDEYCVRVVYGNTGDYYSMSCEQCITPEYQHHWQVDPDQFENHMTVIGNVSIDDTVRNHIYDNYYPDLRYFEVGAFCGDECRGSGRTSNYSPYTFPIYGNEGDAITFRLYSHNYEKEIELPCESDMHLVPDVTYGTNVDPYIFDFYKIKNQCTHLNAGNNWYSSYVKIDGTAGLDTIENALGESGRMIKSQTQYTGYTNYGWFGTLQDANNEQMYVINTTTDIDLCTNGRINVPSKHPITLHQNWNWIGYPISRNVSVNNALGNVTSTTDDVIKSQYAYSTYYEGYGWFGALNVMEPGRGYMIKQQDAQTQTFCYPTVKRGDDEGLRANVTADDNYWRPEAQRFVTNMGVTCVISIDDEIQRSESLEVAALCNGEVRGSTRPMYFEPLDEYVIMLTIYGNEDDVIAFKLYDVETDVEYESIAKETLTYSDNDIIGTLKEPYVLHFGIANGISENNIESITIYPNPVNRGNGIMLSSTCDRVEIFNTIGVKVAEYQNVNKLNSIEIAGSYIIRITNDGNTSYSKIVVK